MNNPFDWFDGIFVINLKRSADRLVKFKHQAEEYDFIHKLEVFEAIEDEVGSYGCSCSHNEILKIAKKRGMKNVLVFEDDATFLYPKKYVHEELLKMISFLMNEEWNILYLGPNITWSNHTIISVQNDVVKCEKALGRFAICYNDTCFDYFLNKFPNRKDFIRNPTQLRGDVIVSKSPLIKYSLRYPVCAPSSEETFTSVEARKSLNKPSHDGYFHFLLIVGGYFSNKMINMLRLREDIRQKIYSDYNDVINNIKATGFKSVIISKLRGLK